MQEIKRTHYLQKLIQSRGNGLIKIITGIRRCGKSYLLDPLFRRTLEEDGIPRDHIIKVELDRIQNRKYHHNPEAFNDYLFSFLQDNAMHYFLLDEIQLVDDFELILNGLLYEKNVDVYVTGSNSRFLSTDIITEFRGRGDPIRVHPLSFSEFLSAYPGDVASALQEYMIYGGMPLVLAQSTEERKSEYLKGLFTQTYFRDILEHNKIRRTDIFDAIVNVLASSIGSLTNPQKIFDTFQSKGEKELSVNTVNNYLSYLENAFIIEKAMRYDIKGRKYIHTPAKYYFADLGLRNARLNFRQQEETHLMENLIFNELLVRGYNVDVGVVEIRENGQRKRTEVDFVCNQASRRYYIQSALHLETPEKTEQETRPFRHIDDNFKKIVIVKDAIRPWHTESGILILGLLDFLLDERSLDA